ncbi:MAG: glycosyltransferase [Syntrophorhabdus sp.]
MTYLSVIVPVRNEERFILETLTALTNQDYPRDRFEILVVDGRSTDKTRKIVEQYIANNTGVNIRLLDNPKYLSSSARNIGVKASQGTLIAVIDGHVYIPNDQLFKSMCLIKEENGAFCLARPAPLDVPGLRDGSAYWIAVARKSWLGHSQKSYIYNDYEGFVDPMSSGFAYDRVVFERVGYFDESFDAAEDVEFHFRLKQAEIMAYTSPSLLIYSFPRESLFSLFLQQVRYGVGRARLVRKHIRGWSKETPIPALIFSFFVVLPLVLIASLRFPFIGMIYTAALLIYLAILLVTGFKEAMDRKRFFPGIFVALAIWITHMGLGWGFIKTIFASTNNK